MIIADEARKKVKDYRPGYIASVKAHLLSVISNEIQFHVEIGKDNCIVPLLSSDPQEAIDQVQEDLANLGYKTVYNSSSVNGTTCLEISWREEKSELAKPRKKTPR